MNLKIAVAGTLGYLETGIKHLNEEGFLIALSIIGEKRIIEFKKAILEAEIDLLICLAHPNILTSEEIELFPKGVINLHAGLPAYRGRHPVNWMLIDGLTEIPVSVHFIDKDIDTGDIIVHDTILRERNETYETIMKKILDLEKRLLISAVKQIQLNCIYRRSQHKELLRYRRKRNPDDSKIDWGESCFSVHNFINALVEPMPNAKTINQNGEVIYIKSSFIGEREGQVVAKTTDGKYVISAKDGLVIVDVSGKISIGDYLTSKNNKTSLKNY